MINEPRSSVPFSPAAKPAIGSGMAETCSAAAGRRRSHAAA
jgi:hypothetical protein